MSSIETQLKKLGLDDRESVLYMTLLTHGPCSVRKLAGISGVNRGSTYDSLKSLRERGLICHYHEDTKQCFVAEDPEKLVRLVNEQKAELDQISASLSQMIPELRSLYDNGGGKPTVSYYEGGAGVRTILLDVLEKMAAQDESQREYYVYSSASVREAGLYASFENFTDERIARTIRVKTIALGHCGTIAELSEHKCIEAVEGSPTYILIYANKCAFISLGANGTLFGVVVDNPGLYKTQKIVFESLWKMLPEKL